MNYLQRITTALDKDSETVSFLAHMSTSKLEAKLLLIEKQLCSANKYEQYEAVELLHIWKNQIMNAIELKQQLNIGENNLLDVQMELPELAAFEMIEKRQDFLKQKLIKEGFWENKIKNIS